VQFYRELIFNPKHLSGPLKPQALFNEFVAFMTSDEPEPSDEPEQLNGGATA
jgi:hypothetical protein